MNKTMIQRLGDDRTVISTWAEYRVFIAAAVQHDAAPDDGGNPDHVVVIWCASRGKINRTPGFLPQFPRLSACLLHNNIDFE